MNYLHYIAFTVDLTQCHNVTKVVGTPTPYLLTYSMVQGPS